VREAAALRISVDNSLGMRGSDTVSKFADANAQHFGNLNSKTRARGRDVLELRHHE
jgi:hypothetical protein